MRRDLAFVLLVCIALAGCATLGASDAPPGDVRRGDTGGTIATMDPYSEGSPLGIDWVFIEVEGYDGPLPSPPPVAGFVMTREGGRVTGTTACNRLGAGYELDPDRGTLRFRNLRNTRMLCDRVASDTEEAVLQAMIATDGYRLDRGTLELLAKGRIVARLKAGNR